MTLGEVPGKQETVLKLASKLSALTNYMFQFTMSISYFKSFIVKSKFYKKKQFLLTEATAYSQFIFILLCCMELTTYCGRTIVSTCETWVFHILVDDITINNKYWFYWYYYLFCGTAMYILD